jgi:hypothetical protein
MSHGRPYFAAIDDVLITITAGSRAETRQIRATVGFGVALAVSVLTTEDSWQEATLLIVCAVLEQGWTDHPHALILKSRNPPPNRAGQFGAIQPFSDIRWNHADCSRQYNRREG